MYRRLDVEHIDRTIKCLDSFSCRCALNISIFNVNYHSQFTSVDVTEIDYSLIPNEYFYLGILLLCVSSVVVPHGFTTFPAHCTLKGPSYLNCTFLFYSLTSRFCDFRYCLGYPLKGTTLKEEYVKDIL